MSMLTRRLALWGGAAAIAAGGFAFMASGTTNASSASEAVGSVTGYTVSAIKYCNDYQNCGTGTYGRNHPQSGNNMNTSYTGVEFTVTSMATTSNANGQPSTVIVYPEKATGSIAWGSDVCAITGSWTIAGTGHGSGTYKCAFSPVVPSVTLGKLDVEANQ